MARMCVFLLVVGLLAPAGASHLAGQTPASYPITSAPPAFADAVKRGEAVITALQVALLAELTSEMQRGGPSSAVKVCHLSATAVAQDVARKQGMAAGRTSHRLRNPTNAPKAWAAPIVASYAGKPAAGVDGFVVDLGDRVGLIKPIGVQPACLACHGPREQIAPAILRELTERYPGDQAVGFKEGDIRGWFWVEVAKSDAPKRQGPAF